MSEVQWQELSRLEEDEFNGLPLYIKEHLTCKCVEQRKRRVYENIKFLRQLLPEYAKSFPKFTNVYLWHGALCTLCWKPTKKCVRLMVETCEECEKYYVPDEFPIKWKLCAQCDGREPFAGPPVYTGRR